MSIFSFFIITMRNSFRDWVALEKKNSRLDNEVQKQRLLYTQLREIREQKEEDDSLSSNPVFKFGVIIII